MREQMQEQERREQQQKQQAAQFMQQRVPVSQTPAINVSVPASLPPATQVPMEVLKVRWVPVLCSHSPKWALCSRDVGEIFFSTKILQISFTLAWFAAWFGVPIFKIENLVSLWPFFPLNFKILGKRFSYKTPVSVVCPLEAIVRSFWRSVVFKRKKFINKYSSQYSILQIIENTYIRF